MKAGQRRSRPRRVVAGALSCVALLALTECLLRGYLAVAQGVPFFRPSELVLRQYPELRLVREAPRDERRCRILLLGGSVLHEGFGNVPSALEARLREAGLADFRIFNLSMPAHTSRDSYLKLKALAGERFDAIVVYHAINEVRANNCPPRLFRPDYSHYGWYELGNLLDRHRSLLDITVIPYVLEFVFTRLVQTVSGENYVPVHAPRPEWVRYGGEIKTASPFADNLRAIIREGRKSGSEVLLLTFASYLPEGYTLTAFQESSLDYAYAPHSCAVEMWGEPGNVLKGLEAHNAVLRELARQDPTVTLIDMDGAVPKQGRYFADVCHLSPAGAEVFAALLAEKIGTRCAGIGAASPR